MTTVNSLKSELQELGLPTNGLKRQLMERLERAKQSDAPELTTRRSRRRSTRRQRRETNNECDESEENDRENAKENAKSIADSLM